MIRIKICGISDIDSALVAAEAGADAVGLVFAPSRRQVTVDRAQAIGAVLPPFVSKVGVFVNEDPASLEELIEACGLDVVQLHGDESPEVCAALRTPVVKAIRVKDASSVNVMKAYRVAAFLLDAYVPELAGGSGRPFDWDVAAQAARSARIILSGGLTPDNVAEALDRVRPFGVDVSSGVETDGRKDPEKIRAFISQVRDWEHSRRGE